MSADARDRVERASIGIFYAVIGTIVLFTLIPVIAQLVAALVYGFVTGTWPPHQGLAAEGDFPLWDPQLWLAWIPVVTLGFWIV